MCSGSGSLQPNSTSLASADAEATKGALPPGTLEFFQCGQNQPGAAGPDRMSQGDRAAIGIEFFQRNRQAVKIVRFQQLRHGQDLSRKGLVDLDDIGIARFQAGPFWKLVWLEDIRETS